MEGIRSKKQRDILSFNQVKNGCCLEIDTIRLHGDNKNALKIIKAIRKILTTEKIKITSLKYFIC